MVEHAVDRSLSGEQTWYGNFASDWGIAGSP